MVDRKHGVTYVDDYIPHSPEEGDTKAGRELHLGAVLCFEIGGINNIIPLTVAAALDLPVIDGDGMGRAFPSLQVKH